jgi:predicted NBD/HSP70 family sugar kinase
MSEHILGIDVGGSRIRLLIVNKDAVILAEKIIELTEGMTVDKLNKKSVKKTEKLLKSLNLEKSDFMGITMGSAGVVDKENKIMTESPNVPKSMEGIEVVPALGKEFGWDKLHGWDRLYVCNDCSAAAECAKRFGHKRDEIKLGDPFASEPYAFRFANRPGDDTKKDYEVVIYWTISSGTNIGVKIGDMLFNGEFGTTPEFGHHYHVDKDPYGNELKCGDGATGHIEAILSGGGIAKIIRNGIKSGAISKGPLYEGTVNEKNDKALPVIMYDHIDDDENAKKIADFVSLTLARVLGLLIVSFGPGKIEIGGGVMKNFRKVLIPAINLLDENKDNAFYLQRGKTSLPDICVAKDYGTDYVWKGAIAGFLSEFGG